MSFLLSQLSKQVISDRRNICKCTFKFKETFLFTCNDKILSTSLLTHRTETISQISVNTGFSKRTMSNKVATSTNQSFKFCANLSFMFKNKPFLQKYKLAKEAGFKGVESAFPLDFTEEAIVKAKEDAGIEQILINVAAENGRGYAALPGERDAFKSSFTKTISLAKKLKVKKIHIMSGLVEKKTVENDNVYEDNLKYAVDILEKENILGLIEPINPVTIPNYYMNNYERALEVVRKINSNHLKIMLDIFHLQHIRSEVENSIHELLPYVGHIQIAQVPGRNEPDTPGELNYKNILAFLNKLGYNDWIGLEYNPISNEENGTQAGLKWIKDFGYQL